MSQAARTKVLVLGGGFAGTSAVAGLAMLLPEDECEVSLVNRRNHLLHSGSWPLWASVPARPRFMGCSSPARSAG